MEDPRFRKVGEIRVSMLWVNILAISVSIPVVIGFGEADLWLHGLPSPSWWEWPEFFGCYAIQLVIHELLHGIGYVTVGRLSWNQLRFGVNPRAVTLYCNCLAPVGLRPFRLVTLLPILILFPLSVALWLVCRTWWLGYLAAITLLGGFGDVIMLVKTLGHDSDLFIVEHPAGIGGDLFAACPITDDDLTKPDIRFTNTGEDEV